MQTTRLASILGRTALSATKLIRRFSSGSDSKIYELRFYQMKPEGFRESLDLLNKYWSVRTAHSKDVGSWMTEIGAICETVHLWEYDGLADRFKKRLNVADDEVWQKEFMPKFFHRAHMLSNVLMKLQPGTELRTDFSPSNTAVYELQSSDPYSPLILDQEGEIVIGQFTDVYGPTASEYILVRYTDPDMALKRAYHRRKAMHAEGHQGMHHAAQGLKGFSRLMVPCSWSPIQ